MKCYSRSNMLEAYLPNTHIWKCMMPILLSGTCCAQLATRVNSRTIYISLNVKCTYTISDDLPCGTYPGKTHCEWVQVNTTYNNYVWNTFLVVPTCQAIFDLLVYYLNDTRVYLHSRNTMNIQFNLYLLTQLHVCYCIATVNVKLLTNQVSGRLDWIAFV